MGVSGQNKCLWQTTTLSFDDVLFALEQLLSQQQSILPTDCSRTRVVIDANIIGYKYTHTRSPLTPDGAVQEIAKAFSRRRIDVHIICNHPTNCHHSKQASCQQRAKTEKQQIQLIAQRNRLQQLLYNPDDSVEHGSEINNLQKKISRLENAVKQEQLPPDFAHRCKAFVKSFDFQEKGKITFEIAPFQADPCLAKCVIDREADFIISNDSDFAMFQTP